MTFDMQPSLEFARLTAEADALRQQMDELIRQDPRPESWGELHATLLRHLHAVHDALKATPERQFLDEVKDDEVAAYDQAMAAELARRGRMVSVLALSPEGKDVAAAIANEEYSDSALPDGMSDPLTVIADVRRMSAAQVAACLRKMADHIDQDGMVVYRGRCPAFWWHVQPGDEWWAHERTDRSLRHSRSRRD